MTWTACLPLIDQLRGLLDEYAEWQSNLPDNLAEAAVGERLAETVEGLEETVDRLESLDLPKGFGRD